MHSGMPSRTLQQAERMHVSIATCTISRHAHKAYISLPLPYVTFTCKYPPPPRTLCHFPPSPLPDTPPISQSRGVECMQALCAINVPFICALPSSSFVCSLLLAFLMSNEKFFF